MSRKAGKARQLSVVHCVPASGPEAGRAGRGGGKMSLLQPEEQKIFGSKGHAAGKNPLFPSRSSNPNSVLPFCSPAIKLQLFQMWWSEGLKTKGMVEMPKI